MSTTTSHEEHTMSTERPTIQMNNSTDTLSRESLAALLDAHAALGTSFEYLVVAERAARVHAPDGGAQSARIQNLAVAVQRERDHIEAYLREAL